LTHLLFPLLALGPPVFRVGEVVREVEGPFAPVPRRDREDQGFHNRRH